MAGSILRVGDTTNVPGPIESLAPWVSESKITAVGSATGLTTADSGTVASSTKYLITDPIDVAPHMQQAMDSCCDYWLARIRDKSPDKAFAMYQRDLRLAMEQDQLAPLSGRSREVWHDGGWRSPLLADRGT
jgi:nitrate reductase alpha subunit